MARGAERPKTSDFSWTILHAVPVGENGSDIDYVVIGPAVSSRSIRSTPDATIGSAAARPRWDGDRVAYVRNSKFEAKRTSKFLTTALGGVPGLTTGLIAVMALARASRSRASRPTGTSSS